jgi:D-threonine aldolase
MKETKPWYIVSDVHQIDSPALLVYTERVKHNIYTAISMVGDVQRLRPHVKTNKSIDAVKLMQEAGIQKFKCATISEAEMLGMAKAGDVILAYQPTGPKLQRFIELVKRFPATRFSCLTDNIETAREQAAAFKNAGLRLDIYIDLNVGMDRTGIAPGPGALELIKYLSACDSIENIGLHIYDGHMRNPDFAEKEVEVNNAFNPVEHLVKEMAAEGLAEPNIVIGGSPGFSVHAKRKNVECSPGTFIYWDKGYADICKEQNFQPAAVLVTRVVSFPAKGLITTDLGHKSVAAENDISRRIFFMQDENLEAIRQSEEHLVLENHGNKVYKVGDVVYGLPYHICPTVALYESVITIENGSKTGEWATTARDKKITV